jgi:eukaryotic-like serine/threonine-protein kinase
MTANQIYGGRYEVLSRAGTGGMAEVYRARDDLLGREVALKVLSDRFAGDRSFVERFRREAQSAANLSHPNIVSLYDYGAENGSYFIVMEFIDGMALSDLIDREGALMPERAADIASEVAGALQRAHSAGLVHRDIKPGNIMITTSGQTKVTDFGIARALTRDGDQTVTQTGMVIGTAAYLSPEQAQGNPVDARSDVYSLGCVLYEMLTGRAPFEGDSPLSVAYKHVRESPRPPSAQNPDVPSELDAIVMKAMAKNPDNRYESAAEMQQDLQAYLQGHPVLATPLLAEDTMVAAPGAGTQVLTDPGRTSAYAAPEPSRGRGAGFYILLTLLILALFGLLAWLLLDNLLNDETTTLKVPNVVGKEVGIATSLLRDKGFEVEVDKRRDDADKDEVIDQDPPAGDQAEEGSTVTLTVSRGERQIKVPSVVDLPQQEAEDEIVDANLSVGSVGSEPSSDVEEGNVIRQNPEPGERVDPGDEVDLVISEGAEEVTVPDVVNQTEEQARANLEALGLEVDVSTAPSDSPEGVVIAQDPPGGSPAEVGDHVRITVSEGPETFAMPSVIGDNGQAAERSLESDFGLDVSLVDDTQPCAQPPGSVCRQDPAQGTSVSQGDPVTLFVAPNP